MTRCFAGHAVIAEVATGLNIIDFATFDRDNSDLRQREARALMASKRAA